MTTPGVSKRMSAQRSRNTRPERAMRSALHSRGMRFRIHQRPLHGLKREADLVFRRARVAVFVDGCFWHGCPQHGTRPTSNSEYWEMKIETNISRDRLTDAALSRAGWLAVRLWEHEPVGDAADRIERLVKDRLASR